MTTTRTNIEMIANQKGFNCKTVIQGTFDATEFIAVSIKRFTTAFFEMNNETFDFEYSYTYNAMTDKKTKRLPKGF